MISVKRNIGLIFILAGMVFTSIPSGDLIAEEGQIAQVYLIDDDSSEGETVFTEIHITPDGAYAVDSSGVEREYDFSRGKFESDEADDDKTTRTVFGRKKKEQDQVQIPSQEQIDELVKQAQELEYESRRISGLKLGKVTIEEDETVKGPIFSVSDVIVRGEVVGDVISYKRITVTSTGKISGNATAPDIIKMRGGRILGKRIETDFPTFQEVPWPEFPEEPSYVALIVNTSIFGALIIFCLLGMAITPKPIERIRVCLGKSPVKSFLLGLLYWIAYAPLFGLLSLTIIGVPIAILVLPIATIAGIILGSIGFAQLLGEKLLRRSDSEGKSRLTNALFGILVLDSFWLIMSLFYTTPSSVSQGFATLFMVLAIVVWSIAITTGIGAVILTRFGSRDCKKSTEIRWETPRTPSPPPPTPPPLSRGTDI